MSTLPCSQDWGCCGSTATTSTCPRGPEGTEGRNGARVRAGLLQVVRAPAGETAAGSWRPINRDDGDENLTLKQIRGEGRSQTGTTRLVGQDSLVANNRYSLGIYWRGNWGTWQNSAGLGRGANWAASIQSCLSGPGFSFAAAHPSHLVSLLMS